MIKNLAILLLRVLQTVFVGVRKKQDVLDRRMGKLEALHKRATARLETREKELQKEKDRLLKTVDAADKELRDTKALLKRYEQDLEFARDRIRMLEDMSIPGLAAQNKMLLEMWDAETAVHVKRRVAASLSNEVS